MRKVRPAAALIVCSAAALMVTGAVSAARLESREGTSETAPMVAAELAQRDTEIAAWSNALAVDPESAIALGQLAGLHLQRARETGNDADYASAGQYARRSLALRVDRNAKSYVTLATALVAEHRFVEAEDIAARAVAHDPAMPQYAALLGEIRMELGDYAGARVLFDSLYRFQSTLSIAPRLARWAELNGNTVGAYRILKRATEQARMRSDIPREQLAWFHYRLGDFEMRRGKFNRARKEFRRGLVVEPADHRILTALAKLELIEGDAKKAIVYAERALSLRIDPAPLAVLADAHLERNDSAAAEEIFRAMEIALRDQSGLYHRASSLFLLDHNGDAHEVHENAVRELETRKDIYGYDVLAWSLFRLGRFDEAAQQMQKALQLRTRDASLYYHAGMIEKARGHRNEAREYLEASLRINHRFDHRQARIARATLDSLQ